MKSKFVGLVSLVTNVVVTILIFVGLGDPWLALRDRTTIKKITINQYWKADLRHTCGADKDHAFNEGCLLYQGSVIMIVLCTTSLITVALSSLYTLAFFLSRGKLSTLRIYSEPSTKEKRYISVVSAAHLALAVQLIVAVAAYDIASRPIREDFGYVFSTGWALVLVSAIIALYISVMLFALQFFVSMTAGIKALRSQGAASLTPLGVSLIAIALCTSLYNNFTTRISIIDLKKATSITRLSNYCGAEVPGSDHLCGLYRASVAAVVLSLLGGVCATLSSERLSGKRKSVGYSVGSFVFFLVGFVSYAVAGERVKRDMILNYGLGWTFYLCGVCFCFAGTFLTVIGSDAFNEMLVTANLQPEHYKQSV